MGKEAADLWELEVGPRFAGHRLDQFLAKKLPELSRSYIQRLIDDGAALVDGGDCQRAQRLHAGQVVEFRVPEPQASEILAEDIPLDIVYQDQDLLLVDKPAGMVVHPTQHARSGTLVNALLFQIHDLSGINGVERPGIVHRIDKDTTGLLVVAKNDSAHRHLSDQFRAHSIDRLYVALCWGGRPAPSEGTVITQIGRDPYNRIRQASRSSGGKEAITHYRLVEDYGDVCLVECALDTGRTHQIRVHMTEMGHPLVSDPVYGGKGGRKRLVPLTPELDAQLEQRSGQLLHAAVLGFIHPRTDEYVRFRRQPAERMLGLIRSLRSQRGLDPAAPGPWDRDETETFGSSR